MMNENENELTSSEIDNINKNNTTVNITGPAVHIDSHHIQAIRTGKIVHPSLNKASSTSKIPLSPNIKKKRQHKKLNAKTDTIVDEKAVVDEKSIAAANLSSSIATITNILQVNDGEDRISEHKSRFSDEIHRIKILDEPAGLKRPHEERPPIFFAWPSAPVPSSTGSVPKHIKNPPFALDGNNSNEKWKTEYSESYSSLPSTFYSSIVIQKPLESQPILNNEASGTVELTPTPKKPKPSEIDYTRAGVPSRKIPSIVIPSFFAWGPTLFLDRDETDKGGKKVNIKPADSSEDVIIKSDDMTSILDSEYNKMYINPPPGFIPRAQIVKRTPKSPIVLFTEFKPVESDGEGFLAVQSKKRPSAPLPQFILGDDISSPMITSLEAQKEIVCSDGIESSRDFFIPIDNIKEKDNDSWVLVDNPIVTASDVNWVTPSKQISQNKKQKIMTNRKKKVIGPVIGLTITNLMTPQQFETVKKDKPLKNILSVSEYDAKFTNHFSKEGSNFVALVPKKKAVAVLKRKYDSSK